MLKTNDQRVGRNIVQIEVKNVTVDVLKSEQGNRLEDLSDNQLFQMCKEYGLATLIARRKFLGLLPEVNRRELWKAKGFRSIGHFAAKLAGVTKKQLRKVINLEKRFVDLPILHQQLVSGEVSCNKLVRVAAIVTPENEAFWATQTKNLSQKGLETLVRDQKVLGLEKESKASEGLHTQIFLTKDLEPKEVLRAQTFPIDDFTNLVDVKLPLDVAEKLEELKGKGLDIGEILRELLAKRDREITQEKVKLGEEQERRAELRVEYEKRVIGPVPKASRYIPVKIKRVLAKEHGKKCGVAICQREAVTIHHALRFAMSGYHDPRLLVPLCGEHHEITHKIDINCLEKSRVLIE